MNHDRIIGSFVALFTGMAQWITGASLINVDLIQMQAWIAALMRIGEAATTATVCALLGIFAKDVYAYLKKRIIKHKNKKDGNSN